MPTHFNRIEFDTFGGICTDKPIKCTAHKLPDVVSVLGERYSIFYETEEENENLKECDGYCDKTAKKIVVTNTMQTDLERPALYIKKVLRHEIAHAFLFESGLHECSTLSSFQDETLVDWIAVQGPKIYKAWKEAEAL